MKPQINKVLLTAFLVLLPRLSSAVELEVDPHHSSVGFEIKHLVMATVRGSFTEFTGSVDFDEKNLKASKVNFTIKADSITTNNPKRDEHLRSPDFFDTKKFPEASFVSTSIKANGKGGFVVEGNLTIHGVTKKAAFNFLSLGKMKDAYGVEKQMFQATTEIVRKDYGLVYNAKLETGGVMIGETAKVTVDLETAPKAKSTK